MRDPFSDTSARLAKRYGYRPYMIERYLRLFGVEEARALLEANERPQQPFVRVNALKADAGEVVDALNARGFGARPVDGVPSALACDRFRVPSGETLGSTPEYLRGWYVVQGLASQLPPLALAPEPGDLVVDACAAPGAKSTQLAAIALDRCALVAVDRHGGRLRALRASLSRTGVTNHVVLHADSRRLGEVTGLTGRVDRVLVDAPCTGEGVIRSDPTRKTSRSMRDVLAMSRVQSALLGEGLRLLRPGGRLAYSTCSLAPEEGEFVVDNALRTHPLAGHLRLVPLRFPLGRPAFTEAFGRELHPGLSNCVRTFPHSDDVEGFFVALFERNG